MRLQFHNVMYAYLNPPRVQDFQARVAAAGDKVDRDLLEQQTKYLVRLLNSLYKPMRASKVRSLINKGLCIREEMNDIQSWSRV